MKIIKVIFAFLISFKVFQINAMQDEFETKTLPFELYPYILSFVDQADLSKPSYYKDLVKTSKHLHEFCPEFYQQTLKNYIKEILNSIDENLAKAYDKINIFDECKSFEQVYASANAFLNKPILEIIKIVKIALSKKRLDQHILLQININELKEVIDGNLSISKNNATILDLLILRANSEMLKFLINVFEINVTNKSFKLRLEKIIESNLHPLEYYHNKLDSAYIDIITTQAFLPVVSNKEFAGKLIDDLTSGILAYLELGIKLYEYEKPDDLSQSIKIALNQTNPILIRDIRQRLSNLFAYLIKHNIKPKVKNSKLNQIKAIFLTLDSDFESSFKKLNL